MSVKHNPEGGKGYAKLKTMQTIEEVLETAIGFEKTARDFYTELSGTVSKPLRGLIQELADEEAEHYRLFTELKERADIQEHISDKIQTPPNDHLFSDYLKEPNLGKEPSDQDILLYALAREQAAMEQYAALAKEATPGAMADLFQYLAHEELEHKKELEKVYYEIVHSGGV
jgi:rubrerythrin